MKKMPVVGAWVLMGLCMGGMAWAQESPFVLLKDNFDDKTVVPGTLLEAPNSTPQVGAVVWDGTMIAGTFKSNVWIQSDMAVAGNALKLTRDSNVVWQIGSANLSDSLNLAVYPAPGKVVRLSADLRRHDAYGTGAMGLRIGSQGTSGWPVTSVVAGGTVRGSDYVTGLINSGYNLGTNDWSTIEMIVSFGATNGAGIIGGTYDIYLTRGPSNSAGALPRTCVLSGLRMDTNRFTTASDMRIQLLAQPYQTFTNRSTIYWDNIQLEKVVPRGTVITIQ